ncbi:AbrB/MazE/SpoVT family DNA-binding domain-containing protein [Wukongibacter baidiensis]|uniref:AbrB/MazE/SpoVT family DNA-binding domain-containing protein n=1 Tax=Wukongibacter baidiensis TaxID=1723361 RepID=UPI003D7FBD0A
MKATGIVRRLDHMGRIVIPIELRRTKGIEVKDPVEISIDSGCIVIEKYVERCYICENTNNVRNFGGKYICEDCIEGIADLQ